MGRTPSERLSSAMVAPIGQALKDMTAPQLSITLRMMVCLQKSEIRQHRQLSQSWDDICAVFVAMGYTKAQPKTIARYYYSEAPKKLQSIRNALALSKNSAERAAGSGSSKDQSSAIMTLLRSTGTPVIRGPVE